MTESPALTLVTARPLPYRIATLIRNLPQRLHEREFWIVQTGVLGVTAVHVVAEAWTTQAGWQVPSAFHHIPVVLYLAPIGYASLRYGTEGAVLTGLWSAILTVPNLVIWHRDDWGWLEILYVAVVVVAGTVMSFPVERERLQRRRAEATSQRLELLNSITTLTLTTDLQSTMEETLRRLVELQDLEAACVAITDPSSPGSPPTVLACHPRGTPAGDALTAYVRERLTAVDRDHLSSEDTGILVERVSADLPGSETAASVSGLLAAKTDPRRPLSDDDRRLLAGVASHVAIAIANERLTNSERDRLRSYAMLMTQAQEEERKRIARELHDEASQNVVVIRRQLKALAQRVAGGPIATELDALSDLAGQTVAGMRNFSRDLRPPTLDELGLSSALEQLIAQVRERSGLTVELRVVGRPRRLPIETELALFRIGQAALHNVERHAAATAVAVDLTFQPDRVRLEIADNGRGFESRRDMTQLTGEGKLGLAGMHERTQLVGGTIQVSSRPGAGTRVFLEVPG